jgi:plasmid stability protein
MYEELRRRAAADRRSVSQEVIVLLGEALMGDAASDERRRAALAESRLSATRLGAISFPDPVELIRQDRDR